MKRSIIAMIPSCLYHVKCILLLTYGLFIHCEKDTMKRSIIAIILSCLYHVKYILLLT